jgi:hypothetical protein
MVSVNPGGEPERDDTGLPPVDIEIPDDARELDRDVQAYHRELRADRRRQRGRRLGWPRLARDGIILPLLACCMILALITGTLLTVFTATSDRNVPLPHKTPGSGSAGRHHTSGPASSRPAGSATPSARTSRSASAAPSASASGTARRLAPGIGATDRAVHRLPGPLPDIALTALAPADPAPIRLAAISGGLLVLVPPHCQCTASVQWLASIAAGAQARAFLVVTPATRPEVLGLAKNLSSRLRADVVVATDITGRLQTRYPQHGLTAVMIAVQQSVSYAAHLSPASNSAAIRQALLA